MDTAIGTVKENVGSALGAHQYATLALLLQRLILFVFHCNLSDRMAKRPDQLS